MSTEHPLAVAEISRDALVANANLVRGRIAPAKLCAVVKDDAYAHGLAPVVETLGKAGVDRFGALDLGTALRVRELAPDALIFTWVFGSHDDLVSALHANLDLGVSYPTILDRVASAARHSGVPARVHLKIDTGLRRAGVVRDQWPAFVAQAHEYEQQGWISVRGVWTHISEASDEADTRSIAEFRDALGIAQESGLRPEIRHLAASAASFDREDARFDMARVGAFVYGIAPGDGVGPAQLGLHPAMTLHTTVVHRDPDAATARIPLGRVHGLYSETAGNICLTARGRQYQVNAVHDTSSDITVPEHDLEIGDRVYLFGDGTHGEATLQEWADATGTIGEELAIRLAKRAQRRYI